MDDEPALEIAIIENLQREDLNPIDEAEGYRTLADTFEGRPVGLGTLADSVGESAETIEDVYEPFLITQGMIARTPRGRIALAAAYEHLGLAVPNATARPVDDRLFD